LFPALRTLHRTTVVRQAANLWWLKDQPWRQMLDRIPHDPAFAILDCLPLPVCQFARAYLCHGFRGAAAFGKDTLVRQTFYGLRCPFPAGASGRRDHDDRWGAARRRMLPSPDAVSPTECTHKRLGLSANFLVALARGRPARHLRVPRGFICLTMPPAHCIIEHTLTVTDEAHSTPGYYEASPWIVRPHYRGGHCYGAGAFLPKASSVDI
jgi:hypothetical protein